MRILALDLERYGPFTDRTVRFREDARLHVVLGANEAGKSTALAAVTDLLFGIEERTRYAFRHDMPALRLGAEIRAADGRTLRFRRRKGRKNTLVDAADAGLPDDSLAPYLGGLTREVFCRAFGLDSASLRAGAAEMLDAEGELGASLFAAASGLRGYRALQGRLEEEAAGIFMPRAARDRTFYQALTRYEEARKAIRQGELRAGDWRDLNEEIAEAGTRLDAIHAERRRIAGEQARLARLKRVAPLIQAVDAAAEAAARDEAPDQPDLWTDSWTDALGARIAAEAAARAEAERAGAALARAEQDLAALPLDEGLLARAEAVLEAFRGIARHDKDAQDLPRIRAEADALAQNLAQLAARIGLPDAAALKLRQPSDAARTRVAGLVREGRALAAEIARLTRDAAEALPGSDAAAAPAIDPAPLRADLRGLAGLRAEVARRDEIDGTVRREAGLLWLQAGRLDPPVADLAALAQVPLPAPEAIARHRQAFEALERRRERAAERQETARQAAAGTRLRLRLREGAGPLPSPDALARLRAARDALIGAGPGDEAALRRCREAVAAADRAADDLVRDAARAAEQAADRIRLEAETEEMAAAERDLAAIAAARSEAESAWQAAWAPAGLSAAPPAEMAAWLAEVQTLLDALASVETQSIEQRRLAERVEAARRPLAALAARAGLDLLPGLDPGLMLARIEERVAALGEAWERAREAEGRARAAAEQAARRAADLAEARVRETVWREAWNLAVPAIGLDGAAGPDEADSALAAWAAVPAALAALEHQQRRIAGLSRDMEAYRAEADTLVAALGPDLAGLPATAAMKALHDRLGAAQERRARRTDLASRCREAAEALAAAEAARGAAASALADHLGERSEGPAEDPAALHARLTARRALRLELESRRADLARIADGVAEAELRADLSGTSPDAIEAALRGLALEEEALDQRGKAAFADRDRAERRRADLEGGTGAELALAQRKAAEAELAGEARRWAVLRLAGLLIGTAIGRQRAGQQDPLLARAGALFSGLTGGAFAGLAQDYDAGDEPRLTGRRASGELVPVDGLSEGTRDQLYLALRLAYLEDYAGRAEPAPFVGDDLFLTFDDARTAHGLEALAAIGGQVQPILFTHHRHVADLARARLGAAVDVLEL
ncbi:YhaN family protein [Methylobacterium radiodurans]|uniref:Chromosome segregation protein SMC n=1 Tax=Methylobacterium radiodurans TaxID=2202828 RepID=A0A2U8VUY9_9HYPH|nr:YhaN family protein [Methylobacterium radiodurans]AWN37537.1 chromosome segregation protein SMC [Methylobacterium radiodurans]